MAAWRRLCVSGQEEIPLITRQTSQNINGANALANFATHDKIRDAFIVMTSITNLGVYESDNDE